MHREKHKSPSYQIKVCVDVLCLFKRKVILAKKSTEVCISMNEVTLNLYSHHLS